jgi:adenylate kinase
MASTRIAVASLQRTTTPSRTSSRLISNAARTTSWCGVSRWQDDQYYSPTPTTTTRAPFLTYQSKEHTVFNVNTTMSINEQIKPPRPGSIAFGECEIAALSDLFLQFAKTKENDGGAPYLTLERVRLLLESVGERPDESTLQNLVNDADVDGTGKLNLDEFLHAADKLLGAAPARIVLVVGGPGSGKGELCSRLAAMCGAVHLSCGEMLREEVASNTPLGKEVSDIMSRGDLVSSAVVTALMRRRMRHHPGRRILLDGFPRSLENARDFVELCGPPELALHLNCDDTVMIERIMSRASGGDAEEETVEGRPAVARSDDTVHTAIQRLKNYHKHHRPTMSWLKEIRVPIVELDCSGSKEDVWGQLTAIGRLMRPAVKLPVQQQQQQQSQSMTKLPHSAHLQDMMYENYLTDDANEETRWIA